jgi:hypothetical protein
MRAIRAMGLGLLTIVGAALLCSVALSLIIVVPSWLRGDGWLDGIDWLFAPILAVSILVVAAGMIFIGIPLGWLLRRLEIRSLAAYAVAGLAGGFGFGLLLGWGDQDLPPALYGGVGMAYGPVTAASYWFVFVRRRPAAIDL